MAAIASRRDRSRRRAFAVLCVLAVSGATGYLYMARLRARTLIAPGVIPTVHVADAGAANLVRRGPHVAFRNLATGSDYGTLSFASMTNLSGRRYSTTLPCNRLYFGGGMGVCIVSEPTHKQDTLGFVLDDRLTVQSTFSTSGVPSRVRVSRDGRRAVYTVFVARDSYMARGFSTRTRIIDVASGTTIAELESFEATREGKAFSARDFNYWGVTFPADSNQFYATLSSQGQEYLVQGDLATRRVRVIQPGVECPSVSPDGTRVAFKKKIAAFTWRPAILNLQTGEETLLPEVRNVDDQIEWLDERHVIYAVRRKGTWPPRADVWMAPVEGLSGPTLFLADAESPSVFAPHLP